MINRLLRHATSGHAQFQDNPVNSVIVIIQRCQKIQHVQIWRQCRPEWPRQYKAPVRSGILTKPRRLQALKSGDCSNRSKGQAKAHLVGP
jgi:hypothetical protein